MKLIRHIRVVPALLLFALAIPVVAQSTPSQPEAILHSADLGKILPASVFFRGQSATTQLRNSGGVRFADGLVMLAALVDNSGYSSGIQEKYQAYLITEVTLDFRGQRLSPGAYGVGFLKKDGPGDIECVVQDLGARDVLQFAASTDAKLHRPTPLQVLAGSSAGKYRLYLGRNYVEFGRAQ